MGKSNTVDKPGICRATVNTVGKKFPNKFKNPNPSTHIPINPHRMITNTIPKKKHIVPRIRSLLHQRIKGV